MIKLNMAKYKRSRPTVGVLTGWQVYSGILDSFLEHVIRGVQAAASDRECNLLLACGSSPVTAFNQSKPGWPIIDDQIDFLPVGPWNCDGIVITPPIAPEKCLQYAIELEARKFPVVFAGLQGLGPGVGPDNRAGIYQAIRHLYDHGHRRIAFIGGFEDDHMGDSGARLRAYRSALEDIGIPYDERLVAYGFHEIERGRQAMQQIIERDVPFTAVMASNDLSAMGALGFLQQNGYQVPKDVAVIGFDNRIETRAQNPPLTTIHFPMFDLGYQALVMVLDRIEGRVPSGELRLIPTELVIRESCGCPPGETGKINQVYSRILSPGEDRSSDADGEAAAVAVGDRYIASLADENRIAEQIASIIHTESHRMQRADAMQLTQRCVSAFKKSLLLGSPQMFLGVFQEILDCVSEGQNDLFTWQYAVTVLRECTGLVESSRLNHEEINDMLDRARILAIEAARAQSSRQLISQAQVSERLEHMINRFFEAQDEDEILASLNQFLPAVGIEQNAVLFYRPKGDDPYGLSVLQSPHDSFSKGYLFDTYQFPPPDLFKGQEPFHHAILPVSIGKSLTGYAAFQVGPLEPLADIVRTLGASLHAVRLRQAAIEGQKMAEEANRLKSRFLSMVSHELRAPLNLITGLCDLILKNDQGGNGESSRDDLERIYISAQHLDSLIQDVLDLTLSDLGRLKLHCEALDLKEVLDAAWRISFTLIKNKGLRGRYEVAEDLPLVWADRVRLRQVVLNLLNNAIKFTDHGEIALTAGLNDQGRVVISVKDTGLGIPISEQGIIFQEFRQSERTSARGYGGLGLGLAICKRLVELHGGDISVYSSGQKGQGATFTFTLLPIDNQPVISSIPFEIEEDLRVSLLVSDPKRSAVLQSYLTRHGHKVGLLICSDEHEILSSLLAFKPDVLIMDLETTAERGWEVLKAVRDHPNTQDVPVMFYTESEDGQRISILEMDYLTKPVKNAALAKALLNHHVADHRSPLEKAPVILVVDDDAGTVDLHTRMIQSLFPTARIHQAYNGYQALNLMQMEAPTLVLLDLLMPEMDGFAVLREMRAHKKTQDIPVIVITSQTLNQHDIDCLNQGVVSVLAKNIFSREETLQHISTFIQKGHKRSTDQQQAVLKAMAFIHHNYKEPITRGDIASSVGLSERHLDRCFQHGIGISPITYLNRYRVYQARNLLDTKKIGITAVAMEVGFSSSGYFARVFRDVMGISPRDYLQKKNGATG